MAEFISFKLIQKTRKTHRCTACGEIIEKGQSAYAWTSVDEAIFTSHLHLECGSDTLNHCFGCGRCDDGDGYYEAFMWHAMSCGEDCEPCKRLRSKTESEGGND